MATASTHDLASARCEAADRLEAAIAAFGLEYAAYAKATSALEFRINQDLARYMENPIILHLVKAGIAGFLERRLVGPTASLRELVETQHRKTGVHGLRDA